MTATAFTTTAVTGFYAALPVTCNMLAYRAPWVISVMFVGRLGETPLAAAAMASTLANVSGLSLLVGLSSALSTLGSQAYGAGAYDVVGIVLQRYDNTHRLAAAAAAAPPRYRRSYNPPPSPRPQVSTLVSYHMLPRERLLGLWDGAISVGDRADGGGRPPDFRLHAAAHPRPLWRGGELRLPEVLAG